MKSRIQLTFGTSLAISPIAWSIPLSTIDGHDTSAPTTSNNSGAAIGIESIATVQGISLDEVSHLQTDGTATDQNDIENEPSVFASELAASVYWLPIKSSNSGSPDTHLRVDHEMDLHFAVVDMGSGNNISNNNNISNIGKISHISTATASHPESGRWQCSDSDYLAAVSMRRGQAR